MDIVKRLRSTRADMLGTNDEEHYNDCHEAAKDIERLRAALEEIASERDDAGMIAYRALNEESR